MYFDQEVISDGLRYTYSTATLELRDRIPVRSGVQGQSFPSPMFSTPPAWRDDHICCVTRDPECDASTRSEAGVAYSALAPRASASKYLFSMSWTSSRVNPCSAILRTASGFRFRANH